MEDMAMRAVSGLGYGFMKLLLKSWDFEVVSWDERNLHHYGGNSGAHISDG